MSAIFDTLEFVKDARENGFTEQQAEFQARKFYNLINNHVSTKHDIELIRKDIESIKSYVESIKNEIINTMTIRLGGIVVACTGILGFILKH